MSTRGLAAAARRLLRSGAAVAVLESLAAALVGVAAAALLMASMGLPVSRGLGVLLLGGLGETGYLLGRAAPLVATGLAFGLPLYAGLFNIGGEGQMYLGALAALVASLYASQLGPLPGLLAASAAGAVLGLVIGALRAYLGVNEVVSSIMLNWSLYYLVAYAITVYLASPGAPYMSREVPPAARLPRSPVDTVFLLALVLAVLGHLLLYRTRLGYAARVTGYSAASSRYAGFNVARVQALAMTLAGVFGGLAGAMIVQGITYSIDTLLASLYGIGFAGIGVSLLARNQPLAIPLAALFVADLTIGGQLLERSLDVPAEMADLIVGVIVVALAAPEAYRLLAERLRAYLGRRAR